jgi:hypothetical protein
MEQSSTDGTGDGALAAKRERELRQAAMGAHVTGAKVVQGQTEQGALRVVKGEDMKKFSATKKRIKVTQEVCRHSSDWRQDR